MSTPTDPQAPAGALAQGRGPLRLRMAGQRSRSRFDGGWWPQTRDLTVELVDLVRHFPEGLGPIVGVRYSPADWEPVPRRIRIDDRDLTADPVPRGGAHLIHLERSDRRVLRVLVVPLHYSDGEGNEALLAAATPDYAYTASALLETVRDSPDAKASDQWNDDGGNWWGPHRVGPSFRTDV